VDHSCNKLKVEKDPNSERAQLNKFMHFFSRYNSHEQSIMLEDKLNVAAQKIMKELFEKGNSWIDAQFIKTATDTLMEARRMLKFTYVYGFYLPDHVNRDIFEYLQADLEASVERLSGLLEAKGEKEKLLIINTTEYVRQRQKNLLSGLMEGDINGGKNEEKYYDAAEAEK